MVEAIKRGVIGLTIGLGISGLIMFIQPVPWSWQRTIVAIGFASFSGPFGTVLATRRAFRVS